MIFFIIFQGISHISGVNTSTKKKDNVLVVENATRINTCVLVSKTMNKLRIDATLVCIQEI